MTEGTLELIPDVTTFVSILDRTGNGILLQLEYIVRIESSSLSGLTTIVTSDGEKISTHESGRELTNRLENAGVKII